MSLNQIRFRLHQQAQQVIQFQRANPEACPNAQKITQILSYREGEPVPPMPLDNPCELCGHPHVLIVEEVIITSPDDPRIQEARDRARKVQPAGTNSP